MEESPFPETPPPGDHVTTAVMQDHVTAARAHVTSHTVTVAGSEPSRLAGEAEHVTSGEDTGEEGGRTEDDEAEQRERERIRMKEEEDAKRCQVCFTPSALPYMVCFTPSALPYMVCFYIISLTIYGVLLHHQPYHIWCAFTPSALPYIILRFC